MNNLSNFSEVLDDLMKEKDINISNLAKESGLSKGIISVALRGVSEPAVKTIVRLAKYFNCSVEYILGRTLERTIVNAFDSNMKFYDRFDKLLKENKMTYYRLKKTIDLPHSNYDWKRGALPNLSNLIAIADYFCVSTDYLLGLSDKR
ncbi:MAG: helix-turn-helix domain-containing protein [Acetobacter sp.]|nr:helix-turn-helix domain-containing protein [Acetobacter sp.]